MRRGIFVSGHIPLVPELHTLTIAARDSQGEEDNLQIPIEVPKTDQPPQITSLKSSKKQSRCIITVEVMDEDPDSVTVIIEGHPDVTFKKREVSSTSDTLKKGTFVSDSITLERGFHDFTIVATDSQGGAARMQTAVIVPRDVMGPLIVLLLMFLPTIAVVAFFLSRRKPRQRIPEGASPAQVKETETECCPSCKKRNVKEALYCEHCGIPLRPLDELEKKRALLDLDRRLTTREISEEEYYKLKEELEKSL